MGITREHRHSCIQYNSVYAADGHFDVMSLAGLGVGITILTRNSEIFGFLGVSNMELLTSEIYEKFYSFIYLVIKFIYLFSHLFFFYSTLYNTINIMLNKSDRLFNL